MSFDDIGGDRPRWNADTLDDHALRLGESAPRSPARRSYLSAPKIAELGKSLAIVVPVATVEAAIASGALATELVCDKRRALEETARAWLTEGCPTSGPSASPTSAPPASSSSSSSSAIEPALRAELERTAKALGLSLDDVIANARPSGRRIGRRTAVHVNHRPDAAAASAPPPAAGFTEYEAPASSGMTRKDEQPTLAREHELDAPADTAAAIASVAEQLELEAAEVARSVAPLEGGRRRAKVAIHYPHKVDRSE